MTRVQHIPPSNTGDFLCELRQRGHPTIRWITASQSDARRMQRAGAQVWKGRNGGWVKAD